MVTGHLLGRMGVWLQADQVILLFMVEAVVLLTPHDVLSVVSLPPPEDHLDGLPVLPCGPSSKCN